MNNNEKVCQCGSEIIDVQNRSDDRCLRIDKVGVKDIKYPITVKDRKNDHQKTVASINMYVDLPHHYKGTHMSRFIEVLSVHRNNISPEAISTILVDMKKKLKAQSAHIELEFPYFIEKQAPVSKAVSLMEYRCRLAGSLSNGNKDLTVTVVVPVTTLCPCSKEISKYGAHNQRGEVTVTVRYKNFFWIEDLITLIEKSASSEVYSLLKRVDEKVVTEKAYENPMFVEDTVREVATNLLKDKNYTWFTVATENFESIHKHSAYAFLEYTGKKANDK